MRTSLGRHFRGEIRDLEVYRSAPAPATDGRSGDARFARESRVVFQAMERLLFWDGQRAYLPYGVAPWRNDLAVACPPFHAGLSAAERAGPGATGHR